MRQSCSATSTPARGRPICRKAGPPGPKSGRRGSSVPERARGPAPMATFGAVIALVGAESTGKTTMAHALAASLRAQGRDVALIEEALREFCARENRTPRADEQAAIASAQSQRIADAARAHEW